MTGVSTNPSDDQAAAATGATAADSEFDELHFVDSDDQDGDGGGVSDGGHHHHHHRTSGERCVPFKQIHETQKKFADLARRVFIPGVDVNVTVVDVIKSGNNLLSPYLYMIEVEHAGQQWKINRRYRHFQHLHHQLQMFYAASRIPLPGKKRKERRHTIKQTTPNRKLPQFPKRPDALIGADTLPRRAAQLEEYLRNLLQSPLYRNHHETSAFLEASCYSFIAELGEKRKEGIVKKRAGGHHLVTGCRLFCDMCRSWVARYSPRWLLLKDTFIAYVNPDTGKINFVILMDQGFDVQTGIYQTGIHNGLLITNLTRRLLVNCPSNRTTKEWFDDITATSKDTGRDFTQPNRFSSFAPVRNDTQTKWYVDGSGYFSLIADAMEKAKEEIFIADWMLSPEIMLKRPSLEGSYWRLDQVLKRKAEQGVQIFVLLYKEVEFALGINSLYSKQTLVTQHRENIRVLRHPDVTKGTLLWAHHEKIVVVDQKYAFLGGLDLCYGRWDNHEHRLTDLGGVALPPKDAADGGPKPGVLTAMPGFGAYNIFQLAHATHGIAMTPLAASSAAAAAEEQPKTRRLGRRRRRRRQRKRSLDNEFIAEITAVKSEAAEELLAMPRSSSADALNRMDDYNQTGNTKLWMGKDYANFIMRDLVDLNLPFIDLVDRTIHPRMPWHDIGVFVQGKAAQDVARHFIQRWNFTKADKAKEHPNYPWLLPKVYNRVEETPDLTDKMTTLNAQIIRSVSTWSAGIRTTEESIQNAYVHAIENSEHFIYIENQFFITQAAGNRDVVNRIGDALYHRILRAHNAKRPFRVYVVLPLLPAFEGEIGTARGTAIQAVTHWNYASICRGPESLMGRLSNKVGDPAAYVSFYGLRNQDILNGNLVSELVYVHSKLMIVDDRIAIIGSANLNDRSMLGKRDSEIAVHLEDSEMRPSKLGGKDVMVGKAISRMRKHNFKEFLGILDNNPKDIDVSDPVIDSFYKDVWLKTAALNTSIFEKVFRCLPTDDIRTFAQLRDYQEKVPLCLSDNLTARKMLAEISGLLVLFPLYFLCGETLTPAAGTKEALMPTALWV